MDIVAEAEQYVRKLLQQLDERHSYHNLDHTLRVKKSVDQLCIEADLDQTEQEVLQLAALFHDTGFVESYVGHEAVSYRIAKDFLSALDYPEDKLEKVLSCIGVTEMHREAETKLEKLMKDADLSNLGQSDFWQNLAKLRTEWEQMLNVTYADQEWYQLNYEFLKEHHYYTPAARALYGSQSAVHEKQLKKMSKNSNKDKDKTKKGIQGSRSAQMMFKTALRNHLDLSNLADNKANIMLSVNALIITIAMPVAASYIGEFPYLLAPAIVMLCTCLASMIFATLATRPIKMSGYTTQDTVQQGKSNLFFFGNFFRMSLQEYQEGLAHVIDDEQNLEGSIMRDLYFLGHSLGRKYNQLRICYNIFMLGVISAVLVFIISYLVMN